MRPTKRAARRRLAQGQARAHARSGGDRRRVGQRPAQGLALEPAPRRARPAQRRLRDARQDLQGHDRRDCSNGRRASCSRARRRDEWTVHVRPELVVEIAFNDLQQSPQYPAGMALRFARVKGYRPDKRPRSRYYRHRAAHLRGAGVRRSLGEWLAFIEQQHPQPIALGLERVSSLARDEHQQLPCPVLTVGGTNGKGSTCAMLESILAAPGYRTGLYTSPHLCATTSACASPALKRATMRSAKGSRRSSRRARATPLTYFEFGTLAALGFFQGRPGSADPGGRPRRKARRGERRGRRLRGADERRHRPCRLSRRRIANRSAAKRPASSALTPGGGRRARSAAFGARRGRQQAAFRQRLRLRAAGKPVDLLGAARQASGPCAPRIARRIQLRNAAAVLCALDALELPLAMQEIRRGLAEVTLPGASRSCRAGRR
jgi:hypothetical protein